MAKLRHLAITVKDLEKTAAFYETVFGLTRHSANPVAVSLSDGVVNITLLKFPTDEMAGDARGKDFVGLHHMGFVVDDLDAMDRLIRANGGAFHREPTPEMQTETKYRDIDGNVFDITRPEHVWKGVS
jgi:predicted enzyme related to lactoylglutathione lyase